MAEEDLGSDLSQLEDLNEKSILEIIKRRYSADKIYTNCGDILIAVNPCKELPIYGNQHHKLYNWKNFGTKDPPHVFQVAARAYRHMQETTTNQVILVCGESGSGKTESTKYMVKHIVDMSPDGGGALHERILKSSGRFIYLDNLLGSEGIQINEAPLYIHINPLLEAFGNAKTVRNDNSSRFAKFLELSFGIEGQVHGAVIRDYMLEKSRVVAQGQGEGNFHIFYCMFAGISQTQKQELGLQKPETYRILQSNVGLLKATEHYKRKYKEHMDVLRKTGMDEKDINILHCMLASVLHITQLEFMEKDEVTGELDIKDKEPLLQVADLLSINAETLGHALIATTTKVTNEEIRCFKSKAQAEDGRDALAKSLYERLFGWIINKINNNLHPNRMGSNKMADIGLLDIAGFERLEENSFEQMCINLTNERLQKFMNKTVISDEKAIYKEEGIPCDDIQFQDNDDIINMFEKGRVGILCSLDEESRLQQGTDLNFVHKLKNSFHCQPQMKYLTFPRGDHPQFTVKHYAGEVTYHCLNFLEKNRDTLNKDMEDCMKSSSDPFIADLFTIKKSDTGTISTTRVDIRQSRRGPGGGKKKPLTDRGRALVSDLGSTAKKKWGAIGKATEVVYQSRDSNTVVSFFQKSMKELMSKMRHAEPHFVRCIKPNDDLSPEQFDETVVKEQLQYNGVLEIARIRRLGYSVRRMFDDFIKRYHVLYLDASKDRDGVKLILEKLCPKWCQGDYRLGKHKVFMKEHISRWLEQCLHIRKKTAAGVLVKRVRIFLETQRRRKEEKVRKVDTAKLGSELINASNNANPDETSDDSRSSQSSSTSTETNESSNSSKSSNSSNRLGDKYRATRLPPNSTLPPPQRASSKTASEAEEKPKMTAPEVEEKPKKPFWDIFQIIARESKGRDVHTHRSLQIIKVVTYFILFLILLFCLVGQKVSLMILISGLHLNETKTNQVDSEEVALVSARYILVLVAMVIPYTLIFITSIWKSLFGNLPFPSFACIITVCIIEIGHSIGLCLLVFHFLRELNMANGIMILSATGIVPSLLKPICSHDSKNKSRSGIDILGKVIIFILDLLAFLVQISVIPISILPILEYTTEGKERDFDATNIVMIVFAIVLSSLSWWENFIDDRLCGLLRKKSIVYQSLMKLKFDLQESRPFIYLFASLLKVVTVVTGAYLLMDENLTFDLPEVIDTLSKQSGNPKLNVPIITLTLSAFVAYYIAYTACKLKMQTFSFCLPMILATPLAVVAVILDCDYDYLSWIIDENGRQCMGMNNFNDFFSPWFHTLCGVVWLLSIYWIGRYIWYSDQERLAKVERLFMNPMYCGILLEQHLLLNRRRHNRRITRTIKDGDEIIYNLTKEDAKVGGSDEDSEIAKDIAPKIYACATMWHETRLEMVQILKSLFRMDKDQMIRSKAYEISKDLKSTEFYEFEAHILFDDAFEMNDDEDRVPNKFVIMLAQLLDEACSAVHSRPMTVDPPFMIPSPYGGQLVYKLPCGNLMFVHMKDKAKIRHRKRWSQVMYMYYLLGYRIIRECQENILDALQNDSLNKLASWDETIRMASGVVGKSKIFQMMDDEVLFRAENTFLLALDGDVDFTPGAVRLLMDRMHKNPRVGAACGRIHPIGQGPMVWYQKFEYAVAHWLQKSTEHVLGCVLCSPGCFSLFRGSALMDDNVMRKYTIMPTEASHHLMYDQGEDRWLCTLLLQQGYRVDYAAASDAYTYAPEAFDEFFNQRRRWMPSTIANIMDLLQDGKNTVAANNNISWLYIFYQAALMLSTIIGPSTVLMMIAGAILVVFNLNLVQSYLISMAPAIFYFFLCFVVKAKYQILVAQLLSAIYTFIMMVVLVGAIILAVQESPFHPSVLFLMGLVFIFLIAGLFHPREFTNLIYGTLYFLWVPTGFLLLVLYSLCNMHVVSWGTREVPRKKTKKELEEEEQKKKEEEEKKKKKEGWFSRLLPKISVQDMKEMFSETAKKEDKTTQLLEQMNKNLEILIKQGKKIDDITAAELQDVVVEKGKEKQKKSVTFSETLKEKERTEEEEEQYQKQKKKRDDMKNPVWIETEEFQGGEVIQMTDEEVGFWKGFVSRYLYPLDADKQKQKETQTKLIELRNNICAGMALINLLWIAINFMFQLKKPTVVTFPSPAESGKKDQTDEEVNENLIKVDILGLLFVIYFLLILIIQFIGMIVHRWGTFMHLIAITELPQPCSGKMKLQQDDLNQKNGGKKAAEFCERMLMEPMPDYSDDDEDEEEDFKRHVRDFTKQQIQNLGRTGIRDRFDTSQGPGLGTSFRRTIGASYSQSISEARWKGVGDDFKNKMYNYLSKSRKAEETPHSTKTDQKKHGTQVDIGNTLPREVQEGHRKFGSSMPYQENLTRMIVERGLENKVNIGRSRRNDGAEGTDFGRSFNRDRDFDLRHDDDEEENIYDEIPSGIMGRIYKKKLKKKFGTLQRNGTVSRRRYNRSSFEGQTRL